MVWHDLGLNPGLTDHWRTIYPLGQWAGYIYIYIYIYIPLSHDIDQETLALLLNTIHKNNFSVTLNGFQILFSILILILMIYFALFISRVTQLFTDFGIYWFIIYIFHSTFQSVGAAFNCKMLRFHTQLGLPSFLSFFKWG